MSTTSPYHRIAWQDKFNQPTVDALRDDLPADVKDFFNTTRESLQKLENIEEQLAWYGDSWHWTIEFRTPLSTEPLAVLIPSPTDLQIAFPLDREFVSGLPMKRLKRAVRDGLELAQEPFDTHWGVWSLTAQSLIVDVLKLVEKKLAHLASQTPG